MVRFVMAVAASQRLLRIYHYFPVRGHSFLPCDMDFAVIKRKIRAVDRIYSIMQFVELIVAASTFNKYQVNVVSTEFVLAFKQWWPKFYKHNALSLETMNSKVLTRNEKQSFTVSEFMEFEYNSECSGNVIAKPYIGSLVTHTFRLLLALKTTVTLATAAAYEKCVPLSEKKLADLKKLEPYVPEENLCIYRVLYNWPSVDSRGPDSE
ncbi:uncharacterized protein LOC124777922 [Schistocerca piceifrons]|uniref:uncharacterized protein LOC124777922 n=1 Tax=Schistocerca piceifrons TaxID=274613 RepID=UPI001F5EB0BF|nr:uncharacterized protein LOC124777922 [Schistocerca piceifrons]